MRLAEERSRLLAAVEQRERLNAETRRAAADEVWRLQASIDRLELVLEELVGDERNADA